MTRVGARKECGEVGRRDEAGGRCEEREVEEREETLHVETEKLELWLARLSHAGVQTRSYEVLGRKEPPAPLRDEAGTRTAESRGRPHRAPVPDPNGLRNNTQTIRVGLFDAPRHQAG